MRESERGLTESAADCGVNTRESFANYDPAMSSWKTSQLCLDGEWSEFSETWPRAGMTRNGKAYELPRLAPRTDESESGLLPTPEASNTKAVHLRTKGRTPRTYLPTPRATYGEHPGMTDRNHLTGAIRMWPTPASRDYRSEQCSPEYQETRDQETRGKPLSWEVKFATPKSSASGPDYARVNRKGNGGDVLATQIVRQLAPNFVEWLMGYPKDWTNLTNK